MPTLRRAWLSFCAWRSQGVSSSITVLRSWFFSSGLSSAGVFFHWSKMRRILGSLLAMMPGQRVGVKPVEDLLGALVGKFHQIGQGQHRVPGRVRDHLHGEALVRERVGTAGLAAAS